MASFDVALAWLLTSEDPLLTYEPNPDPGGFAIAGVNSHVFPEDYADIAALPVSQRPAAVASFYRHEFWNQYYAQLNSDEVAKRVFDAAVNMGPGTAVRLLQEAIIDAWTDAHSITPIELATDGAWGPKTVAAANALNDSLLVQWFKSYRCDHYDEIVAKNPANQKYLAGWLARASK